MVALLPNVRSNATKVVDARLYSYAVVFCCVALARYVGQLQILKAGLLEERLSSTLATTVDNYQGEENEVGEYVWGTSYLL